MTRRQLAALFTCSLVVWTVGGAMFSLLPVQARRLGADSSLAGLYMSSAYVATTLGAISSGWLADRFQRRRFMLVVIGVVSVVAMALMSRAETLLQLTLATDLAWFSAGFELSLISILTGLFAEEKQRGRVFGIIMTTNSIGNVLGGLSGGRMADAWGFPALFAVAALGQMIFPVAALFVKDRVIHRPQTDRRSSSAAKTGPGRAFYLLALASLAAWIGFYAFSLGRPIIMDQLGFDSTAITDANAIRGLVALPLPIVIGVLSDRIGRKQLIAITYGATLVSLLVLARSSALWQFWLATVLTGSMRSGGAVGSALITDLVPQETLDTALARYGATNWVGALIGLGGTGIIMQGIGTTPTFLLAALLPLIAIGILALAHTPGTATNPAGQKTS